VEIEFFSPAFGANIEPWLRRTLVLPARKGTNKFVLLPCVQGPEECDARNGVTCTKLVNHVV